MDSAAPDLPEKSVAVAVSGGMDSLYALLRLHEQGLAACAVHGRFLSTARSDPAPELSRLCAELGLPLHVVDARKTFDNQVIRPFVQDYAAAATPNPCVLCNARIKFGTLLDAAKARGARYLATGHYARLVRHPLYGVALRRGADAGKDQSYFLALVPSCRLEQAVFPLAALRKADIALDLARHGIVPPLPGESQEICFVPHDAYRPFLQSLNIPLSGPGPVVLSDGTRLGDHRGLWQYTQGQRRGLGLAWHEPLYVLEKDLAGNALIVGGKTELHVAGCRGEGVNFLVPHHLWPDELYAQVRYRQRAVPADVACGQDSLDVRFHEPQAPAAPGQLLVVYDFEGHVLAGARITGNLRAKSPGPVPDKGFL